MSIITRLGFKLMLKIPVLTIILFILGSVTVYAAPLVFISDIGAVEVYNARNGDYLGTFGDTGGANAMGLATHPDSGNILAGYSDGNILEYDGSTGALIGTFGDSSAHLSSPYDLIFHPVTGNLLVLDNTTLIVQEYDGTTGSYIGDFGATAANLTDFALQHMEFGLASNNLLISDRKDVREFNGTTGAYIGIFGSTAANTGTVVDVAVHPITGNVFVADITNDDVREFNGTTGAFVRSLGSGGLDRIVSITFTASAPFSSSASGFSSSSKPASSHSQGLTAVNLVGVQDVFGNGLFVLNLVTGDLEFTAGGGRLTSAAGGMATGSTNPSSTQTTNASNLQSATTNDPINTFTGELFEEPVIELSFGGPLPFTLSRYYASNLKTDGHIRSSLGDNWLHNFDTKLVRSGTEAFVVTNRGRVISFTKTGDSWILSDKTDVVYQLAESGADFVLLNPQTNLMHIYNVKGKLIHIEDGKGNAISLIYFDEGHLAYAADGLGREMFFRYSFEYLEDFGPRKLTRIEDRGPARVVWFTHDGDDLSSVKNPKNQITTFAYDPGSLLTAMTRHIGNTPFTQTWNGEGKVSSQTDADGNTYNLSYNGLNTTIADPLGNTRVHTHNSNGESSNREDEAGLSFDMGSDSTGRRNSLTDRLGDTTTISYHTPSGQVASVTNADGSLFGYEYSPRMKNGLTFYDLTGITHADGGSESFVYDADGNPTAYTDQSGNSASATYDTRGQVLTRTNLAGGVTTNTYNVDETLATNTDPAGNTTTFSHDALKRPIQATFADGNVVSITYDNNNNITSTTDTNGNTATYFWNNNGYLQTSFDALGGETRPFYDDNDRTTILKDALGWTVRCTFNETGNVATIKDANTNTTSFAYNDLGRLVSTTDPSGNVWGTSFDAEAVLKSLTDPLGNTTNFTSDVMGRITQVNTPLGNTLNTSYDLMGRFDSLTDGQNNTTDFTHNMRGLLTEISLPGGGVSASYAHNALGQVTSITDPNNKIWSREFDTTGRHISSTDPLGRTRTNTYDNRNRLKLTTYPAGLGTRSLSYDPAGNLTSSTYSDGTSFSFTYDAINRLTAADGLTLSYDAVNRIINSNGIEITRDPVGRITQITLAAGKVVTYNYDANGRVTQVSDWAGGMSNFTYDVAGRLISMTRPNSITNTMSYDSDSRLIGLTEGALSSISLTRDAKGQITSASRNVPLVASAQNVANISNTVDPASQLGNASYDFMGRLTGIDGQTYTWNLASQLSSFNVGSGTVSSTYDTAGNRLSRTSGGNTQNFIWNYALGLTSISVEKQSGNDLRYYIHTPGGMLLYSLAASNNARTHYHYDEMGNTLFTTNDAGSISASYAYTSFGRLIASTGSVQNWFTWQGQFGLMTEGDDLYYVRRRYYDATSARFISKDPIKSKNPKEINPYQYALGNPLMFVDVTGKRSVRSARWRLQRAKRRLDQAELQSAEEDKIDSDSAAAIAARDTLDEAQDKFWDAEFVLEEARRDHPLSAAHFDALDATAALREFAGVFAPSEPKATRSVPSPLPDPSPQPTTIIFTPADGSPPKTFTVPNSPVSVRESNKKVTNIPVIRKQTTPSAVLKQINATRGAPQLGHFFKKNAPDGPVPQEAFDIFDSSK